jgi:hypothetical protein
VRAIRSSDQAAVIGALRAAGPRARELANEAGGDGKTPLVLACTLADPVAAAAIVSVLLDFEADPTAVDANGFNTTHWAAGCN